MPYCKNCGCKTETARMCEKCTKERAKAYQKRYYKTTQRIKRTNIDVWEYRLGVKKNQLEKLQADLEKITKRIKEFREYENKKSI